MARLTKKHLAAALARTQYAVRAGVTDEGFIYRQLLRSYSLSDLTEMVRRRRLDIANGKPGTRGLTLADLPEV